MKYLFVLSAVLALNGVLGEEEFTSDDGFGPLLKGLGGNNNNGGQAGHVHTLAAHGYAVNKQSGQIEYVGGGENDRGPVNYRSLNVERGITTPAPTLGNVVAKVEADGTILLFNTNEATIVGVAEANEEEIKYVGNTAEVHSNDGRTLLVDQDTGELIGVIGEDVKVVGPKLNSLIVDRDNKNIEGTNETFDVDALIGDSQDISLATGNVVLLLKDDNNGVLVNKKNAQVVGHITLPLDKVHWEPHLITVDLPDDQTLVADNRNGEVVGEIGRYIHVATQDAESIIADKQTKEANSTSSNPQGNGGVNDLINSVPTNLPGIDNSRSNRRGGSPYSRKAGSVLGNQNLINKNLQDLLNNQTINLGNVVALVQADENIIFVNSEDGRVVAVKNKNDGVGYIGNVILLPAAGGVTYLIDKDTGDVTGIVGNTVRLVRPDGLNLLFDRDTDDVLGVVAANGNIYLINPQLIEAQRNNHRRLGYRHGGSYHG